MPAFVLLPGKQGDSEDGCGLYRALARDRERWWEHQKGDGGHVLPHSFPRLQPPQCCRREKQPGDSAGVVSQPGVFFVCLFVSLVMENNRILLHYQVSIAGPIEGVEDARRRIRVRLPP